MRFPYQGIPSVPPHLNSMCQIPLWSLLSPLPTFRPALWSSPDCSLGYLCPALSPRTQGSSGMACRGLYPPASRSPEAEGLLSDFRDP